MAKAIRRLQSSVMVRTMHVDGILSQRTRYPNKTVNTAHTAAATPQLGLDGKPWVVRSSGIVPRRNSHPGKGKPLTWPRGTIDEKDRYTTVDGYITLSYESGATEPWLVDSWTGKHRNRWHSQYTTEADAIRAFEVNRPKA